MACPCALIHNCAYSAAIFRRDERVPHCEVGIYCAFGRYQALDVLLLRVGALQNTEALLTVAEVPEIRVHGLEDLI